MRDIQITSNNGKIKIRWWWSSEDIKHVSIFYKKKEDDDEWGTKLSKHKIYRISAKETGEEEKELALERGLYTFTFLINEGEEGNRKVICDNIMLGEPFRVELEWQSHKAGILIHFRLPEGELPEGALLYEVEGYKHLLPYPVRSGTSLLIPNVFYREKVRLRVIEPYDKVYMLV